MRLDLKSNIFFQHILEKKLPRNISQCLLKENIFYPSHFIYCMSKIYRREAIFPESLYMNCKLPFLMVIYYIADIRKKLLFVIFTLILFKKIFLKLSARIPGTISLLILSPIKRNNVISQNPNLSTELILFHHFYETHS